MMLPWHSHYTPSMFTCCSQMCSLCSHVICPSWVLILNVTLYYRLVDQGFISVNQLWFIHIWAIMGFQWMMMHGYVLGHITPQQHVLFSLWKQYNIVKACQLKRVELGPDSWPFELVGFICVFFGLLVSMVFLRIACSWIWIGRFSLHSCTIYVFWLRALVIWCCLVCIVNKVW